MLQPVTSILIRVRRAREGFPIRHDATHLFETVALRGDEPAPDGWVAGTTQHRNVREAHLWANGFAAGLLEAGQGLPPVVIAEELRDFT